jgi:hypothetical protein
MGPANVQSPIGKGYEVVHTMPVPRWDRLCLADATDVVVALAGCCAARCRPELSAKIADPRRCVRGGAWTIDAIRRAILRVSEQRQVGFGRRCEPSGATAAYDCALFACHDL